MTLDEKKLQFLVKTILTDREGIKNCLSDYHQSSQYHSHDRSGSQGGLVQGGAGGVTGLVLVGSPLLGGGQEDRQELGGVSVSPHGLAASSERQGHQGAA